MVETWHTTGTKGGVLLKGAIVDAVTQLRISGRLSVAAQHETSLTAIEWVR